LLWHALVAPPEAPEALRVLAVVARDGGAYATAKLQVFLKDLYPELLDGAKGGAMDLARGLVASQAPGAEALCHVLLRLVLGGDTSPGNVWLAGACLEVLQVHRDWARGHPTLLQAALYTFLRFLEDLGALRDGRTPAVEQLQKAAGAFCCGVLREHPKESVGVGRDLLRVLMGATCVPELAAIRSELLGGEAPGSASGEKVAAGMALEHPLAGCLKRPTPHWLLLSRLSSEIELKLHFMMSQVRMSNQRRYQTWFAQKHLSSDSKLSLVPDMVRYVCGVYHPPNHVLCSDVLPRWAVVGWLLQAVAGTKWEQASKLAVLYDWFFFGVATDSIMNVEPAMLLMVNSVPKYSKMTVSLLDKVFTIVDSFPQAWRKVVQMGLHDCLSTLVSKGVVRSLEVLTSSEHLPAEQRKRLQEAATLKTGTAAAKEDATAPEVEMCEAGGVPAVSPEGKEKRPAAPPGEISESDLVIVSPSSSALSGGSSGERGSDMPAVVEACMADLRETLKDSKGTEEKALLVVLTRLFDSLAACPGSSHFSAVAGVIGSAIWPTGSGEFGHLLPPTVPGSSPVVLEGSLHAELLLQCTKVGAGQSGNWAGARLMGHLRATEGGASVGAHLLVHACAHAIMSQENDSQLDSLDKAIDSFSTYEAYTALAADLLGTSAPEVLAKDCLVLCKSSLLLLSRCSMALLTYLPALTSSNPSFIYLILSVMDPSLKLTLSCSILSQSLSFVLTLPPGDDAGAEPRQTASTSQCIEKAKLCVEDSLTWDTQCQSMLWEFLAQEVRSAPRGFAENLVCVLLDQLHSRSEARSGTLEALNGLLGILSGMPPTPNLLKATMVLSGSLEYCRLAILSSWRSPVPVATMKPESIEAVHAAATSGSKSQQVIVNPFESSYG